MNNKLLKQILENNKNYEQISSIEDIDNFIDILENTKEVLIKKRRELVRKDVQDNIKFSEDVDKLIKPKNFNFKEENTLLDEIYYDKEGGIIYCDVNDFTIDIRIGHEKGEEYIYIFVFTLKIQN